MFFVLLSHSALAQDAPERGPADPARFDGTWVLDHSPAEANRILDRGVERAVSAMNYFVRGIARSRLRDGTHLNRRIALAFEGGERITVRFDDRSSYTTRLGRTERREEMRVTQRFRPNGALEQVFETDEGTRWYVYTPLPDGRLRVESTTHGPRMPQPMYFVLEYRRS
jgi:hypothetical protein